MIPAIPAVPLAYLQEMSGKKYIKNEKRLISQEKIT